MSREIKFRTWNRGKMEIITGFNEHHIFFNDEGMQTIQGDMKLMQFTGLCDKNGKEIFEGDILTGTAAGDCLVKWSAIGASFELCSFCSLLHYSMLTAHSGEIIGNIHENPELLK